MIEVRALHQATLLADGRVLVTGGVSSGSVLRSAELFEPSSDAWTATAPMGTARSRHVAVRLLDGRVLIAGGRGVAGDSLASSETFEPVSGGWVPTGDMDTARANFAAVRLPSGDVLVAGGVDSISGPHVTKTAEIYSPSTAMWTRTGHMLVPRFGHSMTLLLDGRVLVAGGDLPSGDTTQTASAEIYSPATGRWSVTGKMNIPRSFFSATLLEDGRVLAAGGFTVPGGSPTATSELYDPATGTWTLTGSMAVPRAGFGLARESLRLADGSVMVAGAAGARSATAEVYVPSSGDWSLTAPMSNARKDHAATQLLDGRVLLCGGVDQDHDHALLRMAEVFTPT